MPSGKTDFVSSCVATQKLFVLKFGEGGWEKVEHILDMTEEEWVAQAEKPGEVEDEAGELKEEDDYEKEAGEEGEAGEEFEGGEGEGKAW